MIRILFVTLFAALASGTIVPFEQVGYCGGAAQIQEIRVQNYDSGRGILSLRPDQTATIEIDFVPRSSSKSITFDANVVSNSMVPSIYQPYIIQGNFVAFQPYVLSFTYTPSSPLGEIRLKAELSSNGVTEVCRDIRVEVYPGMPFYG